MQTPETQPNLSFPLQLRDVGELLALLNQLRLATAADRPAKLVEHFMGLFSADHVAAWTKRSLDGRFDAVIRRARIPLSAEPQFSLPVADEHLNLPRPNTMPFTRTWLEPSGAEHSLLSACRVKGGRLSLVGIWRSKQAFNERDRAILYLLHPHVSWALEKDASPPKTLSPGTHAVLELMLTGIAEKEIARRLNRSVHTVHSHIKRVYRHYDVGSRPVFLSRFFEQAARPESPEPRPSETDA